MSDKPERRKPSDEGATKRSPGARNRAPIRGLAPLLIPVLAVIVIAWAWVVHGSRDGGPDHAATTRGLEAADVTTPDGQSVGVRSEGAARIDFPEPAHDFGEVEQGDVLTHTFVVRNAGDAPLELLEAGAS